MLWLSSLLYPDAAEYDLYEAVKEYFDLFYRTDFQAVCRPYFIIVPADVSQERQVQKLAGTATEMRCMFDPRWTKRGSIPPT